MRLRKLLIAGLLSLGLTTTTFAKGGFGLKGGIGISTISFGDPKDLDNLKIKDSNNKWKVGGLVGISYEATVGKIIGIDVEALITNKGVKREIPYTLLAQDGKWTLTGNLYSLDIPLSVKVYLGDNFNFYAGPYFSYIMGGNARSKNTVNDKKTDKQSGNWYGDDYKDINGELPLKRFDFGGHIGLEVITNSGFGVGARVQKGFTDLTNNKYKGALTENDGLIFPADKKHVTNTGFQIYGIFRF